MTLESERVVAVHFHSMVGCLEVTKLQSQLVMPQACMLPPVAFTLSFLLEHWVDLVIAQLRTYDESL